MSTKSSSQNFTQGLVFGFDVGTGSIGYAVRRGKDFLDVGVLCPEETADLKIRRGPACAAEPTRHSGRLPSNRATPPSESPGNPALAG